MIGLLAKQIHNSSITWFMCVDVCETNPIQLMEGTGKFYNVAESDIETNSGINRQRLSRTLDQICDVSAAKLLLVSQHVIAN